MSEPLVIHVVNAASDRGDLWAEVQRQNALIHELREAVHAHAQTIRDKQAVIDDMQKRLVASEWQTAEWTAQANQLTVANNQKADRINQLEAERRATLKAVTEEFSIDKVHSITERIIAARAKVPNL